MFIPETAADIKMLTTSSGSLSSRNSEILSYFVISRGFIHDIEEIYTENEIEYRKKTERQEASKTDYIIRRRESESMIAIQVKRVFSSEMLGACIEKADAKAAESSAHVMDPYRWSEQWLHIICTVPIDESRIVVENFSRVIVTYTRLPIIIGTWNPPESRKKPRDSRGLRVYSKEDSTDDSPVQQKQIEEEIQSIYDEAGLSYIQYKSEKVRCILCV